MFSAKAPGTAGVGLLAGTPHFFVSRAGFHLRIKEHHDFKVGSHYGTLVISSIQC